LALGHRPTASPPQIVGSRWRVSSSACGKATRVGLAHRGPHARPGCCAPRTMSTLPPRVEEPWARKKKRVQSVFMPYRPRRPTPVRQHAPPPIKDQTSREAVFLQKGHQQFARKAGGSRSVSSSRVRNEIASMASAGAWSKRWIRPEVSTLLQPPLFLPLLLPT
jgi:hypothetical protein